MQKRILLFGPREIGKTRFLETITSNKNSSTSYEPSKYWRFGEIPISNKDFVFTLVDMPGNINLFDSNRTSETVSAGITFFDLNFSKEKADDFLDFFGTFHKKCQKDALIFVIITRTSKTPQFINDIDSYLAKTLSKGAILLNGIQNDFFTLNDQIISVLIKEQNKSS